jgi:hypothetical protein
VTAGSWPHGTQLSCVAAGAVAAALALAGGPSWAQAAAAVAACWALSPVVAASLLVRA